MSLVIEDGRVFTASDAGMIDRGIVVIGDDGRITAVGRRGDVRIPTDATRCSADGKTVLPGLIDMHAHVVCGTDAEAREGLNARTITDQTLRAVNNASHCVRAGITTVRDAGARSDGIFRIKAAIDQGSMLGPRIFPSGQAITMSGGHGWNGVAVEADGPDEVRKAARQQLKAGALCIKLMATGGAGTAGERITDLQLSVDELRAGVEEAHKKGRHVLAHVTNSEGVANAVAAGIDSIEHGLVLNEDAVTAMAEHGMYLCPTLEAYERIVRLGPAAGYYDYMIPKAASVLEPHRASFRLALRAGVKMLAGTDAGGHFWQLGDLADELERMVEAGMTPEAALLAATRTAAECLGWQEDVGTLQVGRWGDILVVDGNPAEDITAIKRVHAVLKGGQLVSGQMTSASRG
jgi:imidazolonepropionase-like amidohydrolase